MDWDLFKEWKSGSEKNGYEVSSKLTCLAIYTRPEGWKHLKPLWKGL